MFIKILPITNYTAADRVKAFSAGLFEISRPKQIRSANDVSNYLFGWQLHPTKDEAVLIADPSYIIRVHPQNDLTELLALLPDLLEAEKSSIAAFISQSQSFPFGLILPGITEYLSEQEYNSIYNNINP
ncbi:MAG: hypothetical protein LAT81_08875 [Oceanicaulis sp.]|nr:hypothetical protein [Oceanicaulis sp.]